MRRLALFTVVTALALVPAHAEAQARLMVGGGLSQPAGDFGDAVDSGLHGRVGLQVGVPVFPVAVRADGEIGRFSLAAGDGDMTLLAGSFSGVLSLGGIGLQPYVLGGWGRYRFDTDDGDAVTDGGIHGGFGVALGALGLGGFAEIRFVNVSTEGDTSTRYFPLTVGIRF